MVDRQTDVDVVVVGAGFAGMYMLHRLRGLEMTSRVFEAGDDVGGTWYWNRYPGARCDVESLEYSYSFDPELEKEWRWTERFATQPEILSYLNFVADRLDLRRDITFATRVTGGDWNAAEARWHVRTDTGETVRAKHFVMATGCLSVAQLPDIPGRDDFAGRVLHTGNWPQEPVDLTGRKVGVLGTGSSGVQLIPEVARDAAQLFVFQRTPNFCVPARNAPLDEKKVAEWQANLAENRRRARESTRTGWLPEPPLGPAMASAPEEREREYARRWEKGGANFLYAFDDIARDEAANETAAGFVRAKIAEAVGDAALAEKLTPHSYPIGAKRICVGTDYYETFNRDNVTLVDVAEDPIERITETGVKTRGAEFALDTLIFATGFDAMTGALMRLDLTGADGARLAGKWDAGPANYLGIMTTGFPNFYMVTGPGSPSVLSNVIVSIEQHVDWLSELFDFMRREGVASIEPTKAAEDDWVRHCGELAERTLVGRANSWYLGANIPGKPRVFMPFIGGVDVYRQRCAEVARNGYTGFRLVPETASAEA